MFDVLALKICRKKFEFSEILTLQSFLNSRNFEEKLKMIEFSFLKNMLINLNDTGWSRIQRKG